MNETFHWIKSAIMEGIEYNTDIEILPDKAFTDLGVDSLGVMTLFVHIEEHFGIEIEEDALIDGNIITIQNLCDYIDNSLK